MPSTYSPSLRIELIGDGEQSGTWGQTTNNNLGTLLEQAIAGTTSVTVTSSDVTLTSFNGAVDEARSAVIAVNGTPGTARNVIIPNEPKTYTILNNTAVTVTVKTSSGTGYACAPLSQSTVQCDGVSTGTTTGMTISAVANALTSSSDLAATAASVGLAKLNSPTFTGNPLAPTAAGGTNNTQIATTAFVASAVSGGTSGYAPIASPTFTGVPAAPTASVSTNTTQLATTAYTVAQIANDAPTKTGTGASGTWNISVLGNAATATNATNATNATTSTTQPAGTSTTAIATTAFVASSFAPLASPSLTGVPVAPTAAVSTNTTQLATTAFAVAQVANDAPTKTGTGASGTWGINISGNAATATSATNATNAVNATTSTTQAPGTNTTAIATTAFVQAAIPAIPSAFPTGTRLIFAQTAAPTGWTKDTTYDNAALRVVSGTAGSGGTINFTTAFTSQSVGATALSTAQMPSHSHGVSDPGHNHSGGDYGHTHTYTTFGAPAGPGIQGGNDYTYTGNYTSGGGNANIYINGNTTGISVSANGSGATHTHSLDLSVKYVDTIIATKT